MESGTASVHAPHRATAPRDVILARIASELRHAQASLSRAADMFDSAAEADTASGNDTDEAVAGDGDARIVVLRPEQPPTGPGSILRAAETPAPDADHSTASDEPLLDAADRDDMSLSEFAPVPPQAGKAAGDAGPTSTPETATEQAADIGAGSDDPDGPESVPTEVAESDADRAFRPPPQTAPPENPAASPAGFSAWGLTAAPDPDPAPVPASSASPAGPAPEPEPVPEPVPAAVAPTEPETGPEPASPPEPADTASAVPAIARTAAVPAQAPNLIAAADPNPAEDLQSVYDPLLEDDVSVDDVLRFAAARRRISIPGAVIGQASRRLRTKNADSVAQDLARHLRALDAYANDPRRHRWDDFAVWCENSGHSHVIVAASVAMNESEHVRDSKKLMRYRTLPVAREHGKHARPMPARTRIEGPDDFAVHVHFRDDLDSDGVIHIGHVGRPLPT